MARTARKAAIRRREAPAARLRGQKRALAAIAQRTPVGSLSEPTGVTATSVETARAVAHAAASGWWKASAEAHGAGHQSELALPAGLDIAELSAFVVADARALGKDFAVLPAGEASAAIDRLYTQALPAEHRAKHGIFYTPPALVRGMLDQAKGAGHDRRTGRVNDPSCGGGAFVAEAAFRIVAALADAGPAIDPAALASRSRFKTWTRSPRRVGWPAPFLAIPGVCRYPSRCSW